MGRLVALGLLAGAGCSTDALPLSDEPGPRPPTRKPGGLDAPARCGDGSLDPGEVCDGSAYRFSCPDFGFDEGTLGCQQDCLDVTTDGCRYRPLPPDLELEPCPDGSPRTPPHQLNVSLLTVRGRLEPRFAYGAIRPGAIELRRSGEGYAEATTAVSQALEYRFLIAPGRYRGVWYFTAEGAVRAHPIQETSFDAAIERHRLVEQAHTLDLDVSVTPPEAASDQGLTLRLWSNPGFFQSLPLRAQSWKLRVPPGVYRTAFVSGSAVFEHGGFELRGDGREIWNVELARRFIESPSNLSSRVGAYARDWPDGARNLAVTAQEHGLHAVSAPIGTQIVATLADGRQDFEAFVAVAGPPVRLSLSPRLAIFSRRHPGVAEFVNAAGVTHTVGLLGPRSLHRLPAGRYAVFAGEANPNYRLIRDDFVHGEGARLEIVPWQPAPTRVRLAVRRKGGPSLGPALAASGFSLLFRCLSGCRGEATRKYPPGALDPNKPLEATLLLPSGSYSVAWTLDSEVPSAGQKIRPTVVLPVTTVSGDEIALNLELGTREVTITLVAPSADEGDWTARFRRADGREFVYFLGDSGPHPRVLPEGPLAWSVERGSTRRRGTMSEVNDAVEAEFYERSVVGTVRVDGAYPPPSMQLAPFPLDGNGRFQRTLLVGNEVTVEARLDEASYRQTFCLE